MSKKQFTVSTPVSLWLGCLCILVSLLGFYVSAVSGFVSGPGCQGSEVAFDFKNISHYLRLVIYPLVQSSKFSLLFNASIIIILGGKMEEKFGRIFLGLMIFTSAFVGGILNACILKNPIQGAEGISFLLIFLLFLEGLSKSNIKLEPTVLFAVFAIVQITEIIETKDLAIIVKLAGGVTGSLFSFLVAPKTRKSISTSTKITSSKKRKKYIEELDAASPRNSENNSEYNSDSSKSPTVRYEDDGKTEYIGTISL